MSIYATQLSAITFIAIPAIPFARDWKLFPGQFMILLFAPVVIVFYLPFFRRLKVTTAYEYLEHRFNLAVRLFGSLSFIIFQFARMAIVVYLPALALSTVTGMDIYAAIVLMGGLSIVYTVLGGMEAVIWTDVLQVIVLWGGLLLAVGFVLSDLGGPNTVFEAARADGKLTMFSWTWDHTALATWSIVLGHFALQFGPYTADQAVVQRYMTTKDERAAARGIWLNGALAIPFNFLFFALGTCLYLFFKSRPELLSVGMQNDSVFPLFMTGRMPPGMSGLVIAGVFAASMSSLDSSMHSVATAITTDFYRRFWPDVSDQRCLKVARWITAIVGGIGTATALLIAGADLKSQYLFFQKILGLLTSGLVGLFILGVFTRRANSSGALSGAVVSTIVLAHVVFRTDTHMYVYPLVGIGTAVVVGYVVSLITPPDGKDLSGLSWPTVERDAS
jgi:SSS family transporter